MTQDRTRPPAAVDVAPRRTAGPTSRGLFAAGVAILLATAITLAIGAVRHFAGVHGPVLPVSWCRSGALMTPLPPLTGSRWLTAWQHDWFATTVVFGLAITYLAGVLAVSRQGRRRWPVRWTASFLAGLAVCVLATSSSIGVYDMAMFSAHMLGHLALVMVAPPLLAGGRPITLALHATRNPWHRRIRRLIRSRVVGLWFCPPVALATYAIVIVGTHLTGLMGVIMAHSWAGQLEHAAYLLVGYQFFTLVIGDEPLRWRLSMPAKELLLAVAMAVDTFTGVILLQTDQAMAMTGMSPRHLDPLADTHLGGAIMWVGGDGIMLIIMIIVALAWLRRPEHRRRASRSWLEQARQDTLATHTSHPAQGSANRPEQEYRDHDVDTDDRARLAYNAWLTDLERHR